MAQTSQARDREKAADYARAGVPDYWLLDLPGRTVTVHRGPTPEGYGAVERVGDGATLSPLAAAGAPTLDVSELLGPPEA